MTGSSDTGRSDRSISQVMAQPASLTSSLSLFGDFVRQQRDAIGRMWMQLVRESPDVPGAVHISHDALQDHVPELMDGNDEPVIRLKRDGYHERPALACRSFSSPQTGNTAGSANGVIQLRAKGLTLIRLPFFVWTELTFRVIT